MTSSRYLFEQRKLLKDDITEESDKRARDRVFLQGIHFANETKISEVKGEFENVDRKVNDTKRDLDNQRNRSEMELKLLHAENRSGIVLAENVGKKAAEGTEKLSTELAGQKKATRVQLSSIRNLANSKAKTKNRLDALEMQVNSMAQTFSDKLTHEKQVSAVLKKLLLDKSKELSALTSKLEDYDVLLSGDTELVATTPAPVKADDLNAAEEGSVTIPIQVFLQTAAGERLGVNLITPVITPSKGTVADAEVGAPTVSEVYSSIFSGGASVFHLIPDTDEGSTKTYVADEELHCDFEVPGDSLMGQAVAALSGDSKIVIQIV